MIYRNKSLWISNRDYLAENLGWYKRHEKIYNLKMINYIICKNCYEKLKCKIEKILHYLKNCILKYLKSKIK